MSTATLSSVSATQKFSTPQPSAGKSASSSHMILFGSFILVIVGAYAFYRWRVYRAESHDFHLRRTVPPIQSIHIPSRSPEEPIVAPPEEMTIVAPPPAAVLVESNVTPQQIQTETGNPPPPRQDTLADDPYFTRLEDLVDDAINPRQVDGGDAELSNHRCMGDSPNPVGELPVVEGGTLSDHRVTGGSPNPGGSEDTGPRSADRFE